MKMTRLKPSRSSFRHLSFVFKSTAAVVKALTQEDQRSAAKLGVGYGVAVEQGPSFDNTPLSRSIPHPCSRESANVFNR